MSKQGKFYSLGIDMLKGTPEGLSQAGELDERILEKALKMVEDFVTQKYGLTIVNKNIEAGDFEVSVTSGGEPVICEVRLYPVYSKDYAGGIPKDLGGTEYESKERIDFYRFVSNEEGRVCATVPTGTYLLKVSKGSEYIISYKTIKVVFGEKNAFTVELEQFTDLSKEGYYAGDIHHHSIYSSPVWGGTDDVKESCKEVADSMKAMGLKYGALSDHHNILNHEEWKALKTKDFHPVPSKEISTSNGHVLSLGVDGFDVIYNIPEDKDRTEEYLRSEFVRITDLIREKKGLPQLNHPRDLSPAISWNRDFYDMTGIFETIEIWNGSNPMYYGSTNAMAADFWRSLLEKGQYIPITTGSDTHNTKANDYHEIYRKVLWYRDNVKKILASEDAKEFEDIKDVLSNFLYICEHYMPMIESWARTSLTSGCVRTYVHLEKEPDTEGILDALRHGHSFLTNGPILIASVNGVGMGDTVFVKESNAKADVSIKLLSNRKLTKLTAYMSKMKVVDLPIKELPTAGFYDYSIELKDFDLSDTDYIFFVASSDITNLAITNPIIVK